MSKAKAKKVRRAKGRTPVVRGPQLVLGPAVDAKLDEGRTPRMRYIERPNKKDGQPFFALRGPRELWDACTKAAAKKGQYKTDWARAVLAKAAGFKLDAGDE